jgi:hypothetical protein
VTIAIPDPGEMTHEQWAAANKLASKGDEAKLAALLDEYDLGRPKIAAKLLIAVLAAKTEAEAQVQAGIAAAAELSRVEQTLDKLSSARPSTLEEADRINSRANELTERQSPLMNTRGIGRCAQDHLRFIAEQFAEFLGLPPAKVCHGSCPPSLSPYFDSLSATPYVLGSWRHAGRVESGDHRPRKLKASPLFSA